MAHVCCVFCNNAVPPAQLRAWSGGARCPACRRITETLIFPALLEANAPKPPALTSDPPAEGEAVCFYSPSRRATRSCSHCGVLISDVWAAQWGSQTVCLKCLEHLREKGKDERFQSTRTLWDNIALAVALVPFTLIFWFLAFITAPAAVFMTLWHWNSPRTLVPRSRFRLVAALLLGLAQIGAGVFVFTRMWFGAFKVTSPPRSSYSHHEKIVR